MSARTLRSYDNGKSNCNTLIDNYRQTLPTANRATTADQHCSAARNSSTAITARAVRRSVSNPKQSNKRREARAADQDQYFINQVSIRIRLAVMGPSTHP